MDLERSVGYEDIGEHLFCFFCGEPYAGDGDYLFPEPEEDLPEWVHASCYHRHQLLTDPPLTPLQIWMGC